MTKTISFRIPDEMARRMAERTAHWGASSESETLRRILEEWLRLQDHPGIRFVDGPAGRRAALVDGPDVWEVISAGRAFDFDPARLAEAYPWLTSERLAAARRYYEAFPDEIDDRIERNQRQAEELERELEALGA